jgi:hypothetical protein
MHLLRKIYPAAYNHSFKRIAQTFCANKNTETIFALSSGVNTAISVTQSLRQIVRVSGPQSYRVLELLQPKQQ